jgi:hypothetical protein
MKKYSTISLFLKEEKDFEKKLSPHIVPKNYKIKIRKYIKNLFLPN